MFQDKPEWIAHQRQRFHTIRCLHCLVAAVPDERDHQRAIGWQVINDKYLGHGVQAPSQSAPGGALDGSTRNASTC